jgi:hypothetical protein
MCLSDISPAMAPSRLSDIKKKIGRPRVGSILIAVRLPPADLERLDAWIAAQEEPKPTRPEALRRLASKGLGKSKR